MNVNGLEISEKQNDCVFKIYTGKEIKDDYGRLYLNIFQCVPITSSDKRYFILSEKEKLERDKRYNIFGIPNKSIPIVPKAKYLYEIDLIDEEKYTQNSRSAMLEGKVKELKRWNLYFDYNDYYTGRKKNTFLNFVNEMNYEYDNNISLERFAIQTFNYQLLANIFNLKNFSKVIWDTEPDTYYNVGPLSGLEKFKNLLIHIISDKNSFKEDLKNEIIKIDNIKDFYNYFETNIINNRLTDETLKMHMLDNDTNLFTPFNWIVGNATLQFKSNEINSSMQYELLYNSYRETTLILKETYEKTYISKTYTGGPITCDLYFPLLMCFRQSIELYFKAIYFNKILKNVDIENTVVPNYLRTIKFDDIKLYEEKPKGLNTHNLLVLLKLIEDVIPNKNFFDFLYNLSSFVYYAENRDPSFSRYIIGEDYDFSKSYNIKIWYNDLTQYIDEFYYLVDNYYQDLINK